MAGPRHHVLLIPGFFGFTSLGEFAYFTHVQELLGELMPGLGLDGELRVVRTVPTASLRKRAVRVLEEMAAVVGDSDDVVSLVGHSSGGLDARLVVTPRVDLPTALDVERLASRVRAVVTVSTPHRGTPVAHLFNSLLGQQLLRLLSLSTIYALRAGRLPIGAVVRIAGLLRRRGAAASGVVDQLFTELLRDFSAERRRTLEDFFGSLGSDQDLVAQITPAGMDLFNASTEDRPGVRYGCVLSRASPPGILSTLGAGLSPYAQATHALYIGLYRVASRTGSDREPPLTREQAQAWRRAFLRRPDRTVNDGMVPTLSQVWGEVIDAVWADHLDVIGHFDHPTHVPPHFDWLTSGTRFDRRRFERLWERVAAWLAERPPPR